MADFKFLKAVFIFNKVAVEHLWWLLLNITIYSIKRSQDIKKFQLTIQLTFLLFISKVKKVSLTFQLTFLLLLS